MRSSEVLGLVAIVVLVVAAAALAMAETALTHLTRGRALAMAEERPAGRRLARLLERPERVLNPILLLEVTCHTIIATVVALLAEHRFGALGAFVAVIAVECAVLFLLTQAVPKTYALLDVQRAALLAAPLARVLEAFWPLRLASRGLVALSNALLPGHGNPTAAAVTEEELLAVAGEAAESEAIETGERELIASVIEFGDTVVREVMVPRPDMVVVPASSTVRQAVDLVLEHGYTRIPACGGNVDDVLGVVHAKDLMRAERDGQGEGEVRGLVREARFVPEQKKVASLLKDMQAEKFHLAVVIDEYGGTAGLVTLEDLIEELVGDIEDEFDEEEPWFVALDSGDLLVNARLPTDELAEHGVQLPEGDWDSVGGCLFNVLGHVPVEGEEATVDGVVLRAEEVSGDRIERVRVVRLPHPFDGAHSLLEASEQEHSRTGP